MAVTAIDDAKRFLNLHPWSTTDVDNPVELLKNVVEEFDDALAVKLEEERAGEDAPDDPADVVDTLTKLLAFIKGLRDDCKICEAEYQTAMRLAQSETEGK